MISREELERKEQKELDKRKKQLIGHGLKIALPILLLVLLFAAFVDEIATASTGQVQSSVVTEFIVNPRNINYNEGVSIFTGMSAFTAVIYFLVPFYKALADKFGRKIFLSINVAGMGIGMFLCWLSPNILVYLIGAALVMFFVQHDMQIIYLYEVVPANKRATIYGIIKGLANLSIIVVPLLRKIAMKNDPELWRNVFIVPVLASIIIAVLIALIAKESKLFVDQRIAWLNKPYEERHPSKEELQIAREERKITEGKTGIFVGLKHLFKEKQLFYILMATCSFALVTTCFSGYTESIMYDYGMKTEDITSALMLYPVIYAVIVPLFGYLSDKIGRKKVIIFSGAAAVLGFTAFNVTAMLHVAPFLVGICYGFYLGFWWVTIDFTNMMSSESVPTNNRGSVAGASALVSFFAGILGVATTIVAPLLFDRIGFGYMVITVPFVLAGIIIMAAKVRETKGVDLGSVKYENS